VVEVRIYFVLLALVITLIIGCQGVEPVTAPVTEQNVSASAVNYDWGGYYPWGHYNLEIARDGSYSEVTPIRTADEMWGYHMNVVKLLEVSPCTNCVTLSNIHTLTNGDVSVDNSIKYPFYDKRYTGFDVRGIIMFPASQYFPDDNIRALMGFDPWPGPWRLRIANHEYGDAELMNPDGWTVAWSSEESPGPWNYW